MVRKVLKELLKTLDETYDRILQNIPEVYRHDAQVVFSLLTYAELPISLLEAAEAVAIDLEAGSFDPRNRLPDPCSILKICSSLVTVSPFEPRIQSWRDKKIALNDECKELRFAHYSVKEYLVSRRLGPKTLQIFSLDSDKAHDMLAQLCLVYIFSVRGTLTYRDHPFHSLPFCRYAARQWYVHYRAMQFSENKVASRLAKRLFWEENETNLRNFLIVRNPDPVFEEEISDFGPPLYYASSLGLFDICQDILGRPAESTNAPGGFWGNALQVAALEGEEAIVRLLLEKGADINAQGGYHGNALQAAAKGGHEAILRLLLERGAHADAQGGAGNALYAATLGGYDDIVRLLIENGAEDNGCDESDAESGDESEYERENGEDIVEGSVGEDK
jgi:hypothetical protein